MIGNCTGAQPAGCHRLGIVMALALAGIACGRVGYDPVPDGSQSGDLDGDGIADETDNCPDSANPTQYDSDSDGVGDVCDLCPFVADPDNLASEHQVSMIEVRHCNLDVARPCSTMDGELVEFAADSEVKGPFELGFAFPFFGNSYTEAVLSGQGWLSFHTDLATADCSMAEPTAFLCAESDTATTLGLRNLIAFFWSADLQPSATGSKVWVDRNTPYVDPSTGQELPQFIVSLEDVVVKEGDGTVKVQLALRPDGQVLIDLWEKPEGTSFFMGVENPEGTAAVALDSTNPGPSAALQLRAYRVDTVGVAGAACDHFTEMSQPGCSSACTLP